MPIHNLLPSQYHRILNFIEVDYHRVHQIFQNHLIDYYFQPQVFNDEIQTPPHIIRVKRFLAGIANLPINCLANMLSFSEHPVPPVFSIW